jgi:hypothetical protein
MGLWFVINGSDLISQPWNTVFEVFTDFLGNGFYIIPLSFIAMALYMKSRNLVTVSLFVMASGFMLSAGSIFADFPEMSLAYIIFAGVGLTGAVLGLFFMRK